MRIATLFVISIMVTACAATGERERAVAFEPDPALPSERCIPSGGIANTEVLDSQNILFYMRGGRTFRNFLPRRCPGLQRREAFSYRTSVGELCRADTITVLETSGFGPRSGATCPLGNYYPMTEPEVDALKLEIRRIKELGLDR